MRKTMIAAALAALSFAAAAQPYGPGPGAGPGNSPGHGPGAGHGMMMGARFGSDVTPGWAMMTAEERREHQARMQQFKDPAECQAYLEQHHRDMQGRARQEGRALGLQGPGPACDSLRPKG